MLNHTKSFSIYGTPKTAGSKKGFIMPVKGKPGKNRVVITDDCKGGKAWRKIIEKSTLDVKCTPDEMKSAVGMVMVFYLRRPKSHYRSGRFSHLLRDDAPSEHIIRPDALKLARAVEDALTGITWRDDAQIVSETIEKRFGKAEGVHVTVFYRANASTDGDAEFAANAPERGQ